MEMKSENRTVFERSVSGRDVLHAPAGCGRDTAGVVTLGRQIWRRHGICYLPAALIPVLRVDGEQVMQSGRGGPR